MSAMPVSVLMPVYNNIQYLKDSIDSVLNQTYGDFEFIILDDGSEEPVYDLVNSYDDPRIVLDRNDNNLGLTKSLNICLDMAKGKIMARHDGDDISLPTRFEEQIKMFEGHDGLVSTWGKSIDTEGNVITEYGRFMDDLIKHTGEYIKDYMLKGGRSIILGPSVMYAREVFEKIGYYDEYFYFSQDYSYWLRALQHFDLKVVDKILYHHRSNPTRARTVMPHRYGKKEGRLELLRARAKKYTIIKERGVVQGG